MRKFPLIDQRHFIFAGLAGVVLTALSLYLILAQLDPVRAQSLSSTDVVPQRTKLNEISPAKQSKAVGFAESRLVRDLRPRKAIDKRERISTPLFTDPSKSVKPQKNERYIRTSPIELQRDEQEKLKESNAGVFEDTDAHPSVVPSVLPTPAVNFAGISVFDTVPLGQGFMPPDTSGEAGPNHYVQTVNVAFRVWSKSGVPLTPTISLGDLFAPLPGPCSGSLGGSGTVIYDQLADRWVITQRCFETRPMHTLIAISKTGDPTGAYFLYDFLMPNANVLDSPKVGVWPDGYYMSDHEFNPDGILFMGASFFAFEREKMLIGDPDALYVYFGSCPEQRNCKVAGSLPSDLDGFIPPPTGAPNVFALFTADEYDDPEGDGLRLFDFHVDFEIPSNSSFTERIGSPTPVQPFSPLVQRIQQPGGAPALETIADRLMYRLSYRHFSDGKESLVGNHTIVGATAGLAAVRYYQLDRTTPLGPFVISEQQTFAPDAASRWMGSTAMNWQGDTVLGYSISSGTIRPSIRFAARLSSDPPGTGLNQGEQTIINGAGLQTSGSRRWGTYSSMSVDPSDDCSFWYTQEYYPTTASNGWHTRIAKFAPAPCSTAPSGVIQGTVTSCSTGLPLSGVAVDATGGFNRITDANGAFSMSVSPGTYDVKPHRIGYAANAAVGVLVSPDAVVTQNFCMAPMVTMKVGVPNVESGNQLLEPNECNLVTIPLINDGAIPAWHVSATLSTATPGVTISPATSSYADIPSSGGVRSNDSAFQVSTDGSVACLSEVDFTLNVSYLGAGPKVFQFTLPIGQPEGEDYVYTASNGGTLTTTGALVPGTQTSSGGSITAPFGFSVYGKPVNAGDTLIVGTSGVLKVTPIGAGPTSFNSPLPHVGFENIPLLFPYWDDIDMDWGRTGQQGGIYVETAGNIPHRTFKVEFRGGRYPNGFIGPININFAIIFHENSDLFEYVYVQTGTTVDPNGGSATVGSQSGNYFPFYTQYSFNSPVITPGLVLSATHPPAVCSAGGGGCAAPTSFYVTGRVLSPQGQHLRGNSVTITGQGLAGPITTRTNSQGVYRFPSIPAGGTYTISVSNRRYSFPSQFVNLNDNKVNVDLVAVP